MTGQRMIKSFVVTMEKKQQTPISVSTLKHFICKFAIVAEAFVSVLLENLSSFVQKELGSFMGFDEELKKLSSKLTAIRAVLADAEMKQFEDMAIKNWLQKVEHAAYMLDDILDECATQDLRQEYQQQERGLFNKVPNYSCHSSFGLKNAMFRRRMVKKMKKMRETLDSIAEERKMFHLCETITPSEKKAELMDWRQTSSVITQPEVYGRGEDKERIVQALIGTSSDVENVISVYPIVGFGGLGKTTLAQLIFNDDRITEHFELKILICVSDDFSLKRMIKAILDSASGSAIEDLDLDPLQKKLQQTLQGKRYLLVLDDVWSEDQEKWDGLKYSLATCGSKGASILVTTRLTKVASIMGTLPTHDLSFLSDEDCWSLFKQRAFGQDEEENVELAAIGKEIVKKCNGLPLAAKALGGLLRFKREEREWLYVKESEIWDLPQDENSIMPALRFSYLNLPLKSRHCFSFCAIFPKDDIIMKDDLVYLWMANGFISSTGRMEAEDVADEIVNELCWASFFQDIQVDEFGNVMWFKIHDLLHDLAQFVMGEACCILICERSIQLPNKIHHLTSNQVAFNQIGFLSPVESLRTYCNRPRHDTLLSSNVLKSFKSLRALDVGYLRDLDMLRSAIAHFKHLRYLNLTGSDIEMLPESISCLCNLEVLNLNYCCSLQKLPHHLKCLKALRHLCLSRCRSLSQMCQEIGQLSFLRTLNIYIVGWRKGFWLAELGQLCLKGQLHIKNLERVRSIADAEKANLMAKQLNELFLSWGRDTQSKSQQNVEEILEALEPHPKLASLGVGGYEGSRFPHWMGNPTFKNLCFIRLMDCRYSLQLPHLGKLPSLKTLEIHNMHHVQYIDDESYDGRVARGFASLRHLTLSYMPNLERLSKEEGGDMFPSLFELKIVACPKLTFPSLLSVRKLFIAKTAESCFIGSVSRQSLPQHPPTTGSSNHVQLDSIHRLNCLEELYIFEDQELISFPSTMLGDLTCLRKLQIHYHTKLEALATEPVNFIALEELDIRGCHCLESLTEQVLKGLRSLQTLKIHGCGKFKGLSIGFECLTSLKDLIITGCPEVVALSEDLQHIPPMLQSISLYYLPNLERLPSCWSSVRSLQSLSIVSCSKLTSLPLSDGWLDSLKRLIIVQCPNLQSRFDRRAGQDWHWIKHIRHVDLGEHPIAIPDVWSYQSLCINAEEI